MSEKCIECVVDVRNRQKAVTCDDCNKLQHRICNTGMHVFIQVIKIIIVLERRLSSLNKLHE